MGKDGGYHILVVGRYLEAVTHLLWGESWGLSHTSDGERDGDCQTPVMGRELVVVTYL